MLGPGWAGTCQGLTLTAPDQTSRCGQRGKKKKTTAGVPKLWCTCLKHGSKAHLVSHWSCHRGHLNTDSVWALSVSQAFPTPLTGQRLQMCRIPLFSYIGDVSLGCVFWTSFLVMIREFLQPSYVMFLAEPVAQRGLSPDVNTQEPPSKAFFFECKDTPECCISCISGSDVSRQKMRFSAEARGTRVVLFIIFQCAEPKKAYLVYLFCALEPKKKESTKSIWISELCSFIETIKSQDLLFWMIWQHKASCLVSNHCQKSQHGSDSYSRCRSKSGHRPPACTANGCLFKLKACGPAPCLSWQITDSN